MKYGVLVHKNAHNIGDDIQSYATSLFLPQVDCMVDREELDTFKLTNNEQVVLIMNAWFLWKKWNWPPSDSIIPKLIGMHVMSWNIGEDASPLYDEFLDEIGGDYLRAYGPVGCRDNRTLEIMEKHNIKAYLSGCITLTLPKQEKIENNNEYICLTDLPYRIERKIKKQAKKNKLEVKVIHHIYPEDSAPLTWEQRKKRVEDLLKIYQNAKCVITTRLHAALPCLAMETPVLCIRKDIKENDRFSPFNEFLYCTTENNFLSGKYKYDIKNPPKNKDTYMKMREDIINDVNEFIKSISFNDNNEYIKKTTYTEIEKIKWQNKLMKYTLDKWLVENRKYIRELKNKPLEVRIKNKIKELVKNILK